MATHSSILSGESHGWRSLTGYGVAWGPKELDTTEVTYTHLLQIFWPQTKETAQWEAV